MLVNLFDDLRMRESAIPYERLARKGLDAYGLRDAKLTPLSVGDRVAFRATEAGISYALHIYPSGWDRVRIDRSLFWQTALCRAGTVRCPEPVLTLAGDLVQSLSTPGISGFRHVTLLSWVDGQAADPAAWTPADALEVGKLIGRLHAHGASVTLPPELATPVPTEQILRERFDPTEIVRMHPQVDVGLLQETCDRVCETLSAGMSADGIGLIHGDLTLERIRVDETNLALVGFHRACEGYAAFDLGSIALGLRGLEQGRDLRCALLEGYAEIRSLRFDSTVLDAFTQWRLLDGMVTVSSEAPDRAIRRLQAKLREVAQAI